MEYLVTMTTRVPDGTSDREVDDIRTREATHSRQLAAEGHLLRLWRPPLQPGEWRSLGLFAASDDNRLERVLASMPLRIWRTDEITPLSAHPNDPSQHTEQPTSTGGSDGSEFLTTFVLAIPPGTPSETVDAINAQEADRARELGADGSLLRLWRLPGQGRALGLWRASDAAGMQAILVSLPLAGWLTVETTPLSPHPSDPALTDN